MKKTKKPVFWIVLGVVVVLALWLASSYNGFIRLGENVNTAWAQVENQYQRRYDLIPNLVETVKGIANQEARVFQGVADARSSVGKLAATPELLQDPEAFAAFQQAQDGLGSALSRLLATVENYPDLKSSENFLALQSQLEGTENRIAVERQRFNETARAYNIRSKGIPGRWLVGLFGLDAERQLFQATVEAVEPTEVKFEF